MFEIAGRHRFERGSDDSRTDQGQQEDSGPYYQGADRNVCGPAQTEQSKSYNLCYCRATSKYGMQLSCKSATFGKSRDHSVR